MMDRKTILIIIGCLIALIVWQKFIDYLYPPAPKKSKPVAAATTSATNVLPAQVEAPTTNVALTVAETPIEPEGPLPPEQIVVLSNDYVRVEFTTHGGGVRSIELLKYRANGAGNIVLNALGTSPALLCAGWPGPMRRQRFNWSSRAPTRC